MIHFVYETTNLINNRKYIGKHSTDNIDDGYLGSGKILLRAIKKYGKENFKREILIIVGSEDEAFEYEQKLITDEIVESNDYYNISHGGEGRSSVDVTNTMLKLWVKSEYREIKQLQSKIQITKQWKNPKFRDIRSKISSKCITKQWNDSEFRNRHIGENNISSKLIKANVIDIKKRLQQGESGRSISKIYNVSPPTIYSIKNNKTWKHVVI
jgi:hypothetical protein